jgi:membrane protease YdiL (CAAX protease family)
VIVASIVRNVAFALLILYLTDIQGERRSIVGEERAVPLRGIPVFFGLFGVSIATSLLAGGITGDVPDSLFRTVSFAGDRPVQMMMLAALMFSVAWVEELFFRGYLLLRFRQFGASPFIAVVSSALLFSVGHGYQGVPALFFAFSAGLFLGIFWIRRPGIVSFTLGHGAYNIVALLLINMR